MKRRDFCKGAAALAAGVLLPLPAAAAQADTPVGSAVPDDYYTIAFRSEFSGRDLTREVYYSDSFFAHSAYEYDHQLAKATFALTCAAENTWQSDAFSWLDGDQGRDNNIADACRSLGFANRKCLGYDVSLNTLDDVDGCVLAQKTLEEGGSRTTIFAVFVRPTFYGSEWANNLNAGAGTGHEGFITAADRVYEQFREYLSAAAARGRLGRVKLWMGGYSRGAAIINLLAAKAANAMPEIGRENIFAYTFATPAALTAVDRPDLQQDYNNNYTAGGQLKKTWDKSNIFNLISSGDIVPRVLPAEWGCHRNGSDRFLPATVDAAEGKALDELEKTMGGDPMAVSTLATAEETDLVMAAVLRSCPDQQTYHEKYEAAFMDMVRCGFMRSEEEVVQGAVLNDEQVVERLLQLPNIQQMEWSKVTRSVATASSMSRPLLERFGDIVPLRVRQAIVPVLAAGLCHDVETDVLKMAAYYIFGLMGGRGRLNDTLRAASCHFQENYFTLLDYYDPEDHGMVPYTRQ